MRNLSNTIKRLATMRNATDLHWNASGPDRLTDLSDFGSNPGNLRARFYVPEALADNAPLVVVLHGCTQSAGGYDLGSGWSQMADRFGFALLFPEQQRANNPNLCFNWFSPEDIARGSGEALSIRQMVDTVVHKHLIDTSRIFVTGLSAGGAMTSVMLATYPEVFAGGAIIAGLPFGCAQTMPQAFDRMRGHQIPDRAELAALVRGASIHSGKWPTVSVWHGTADSTVNAANAAAVTEQFCALHGVGPTPSRIESAKGYPRRVWCDAEGREVIEEYSITGLGHGTPLEVGGDEGCGKEGPFMLEASISSTRHLCRFWGLDCAADSEAPLDTSARFAYRELAPAANRVGAEVGTRAVAEPVGVNHPAPAIEGAGKVIEDALRRAGLMR